MLNSEPNSEISVNSNKDNEAAKVIKVEDSCFLSRIGKIICKILQIMSKGENTSFSYKGLWRYPVDFIVWIIRALAYDVVHTSKSAELEADSDIENYLRVGFLNSDRNNPKLKSLKYYLASYKLYRSRLSLIVTIVIFPIFILAGFSLLQASEIPFESLVQRGLSNAPVSTNNLYLTNLFNSHFEILVALDRLLLITIFALTIAIGATILINERSQSYLENRDSIIKVYRVFFVLFYGIIFATLTVSIAVALNIHTSLYAGKYSFEVVYTQVSKSFHTGLRYILATVTALSFLYLRAKLVDLFIRRLIPSSYIVHKIIKSLLKLRRENDIYKEVYRSLLIEEINCVAGCFQHDMPRLIRAFSASDRLILEKDYRKIANGFRSLKKLLYSSSGNSRFELFTRLGHNLESLLVGAIDELPHVEDELVLGVTKREIAVNTVTHLLSVVTRVAVPFLLLWVLENLGLGVPEEIQNYLLAGAFAFSCLILLIELDPNFSQKLDLLKQIQELIQGRKQ